MNNWFQFTSLYCGRSWQKRHLSREETGIEKDSLPFASWEPRPCLAKVQYLVLYCVVFCNNPYPWHNTDNTNRNFAFKLNLGSKYKHGVGIGSGQTNLVDSVDSKLKSVILTGHMFYELWIFKVRGMEGKCPKFKDLRMGCVCVFVCMCVVCTCVYVCMCSCVCVFNEYRAYWGGQ